jgi:two-component system, cell cycle sensor histidine kinase and response regulator CckA
LLTDVVMPGMGGPELAQHLKGKWPALPVVYTSGYTEHALLGRSVLQEDTPFLQKPYTADALLEQVARVQVARA